jgi:deoxyribonuclease V
MEKPREAPMWIPETLDEARDIQEAVARKVAAASPIPWDRVRCIAGADASYSPDGEMVHAAVVVLELPDLNIVDQYRVSRATQFPYLPGFFAFREGPAIVEAIGGLAAKPELLLVDGHGRAHPRRAGIASHLGLILGIPTIGVAKRVLSGEAEEPGEARGSVSPVRDRGEIVGMAVRTRAGARPVFVSAGFAVTLEAAVTAVLSTTGTSRIPAPLREAHRISLEVRRGLLLP